MVFKSVKKNLATKKVVILAHTIENLGTRVNSKVHMNRASLWKCKIYNNSPE